MKFLFLYDELNGRDYSLLVEQNQIDSYIKVLSGKHITNVRLFVVDFVNGLISPVHGNISCWCKEGVK